MSTEQSQVDSVALNNRFDDLEIASSTLSTLARVRKSDAKQKDSSTFLKIGHGEREENLTMKAPIETTCNVYATLR